MPDYVQAIKKEILQRSIKMTEYRVKSVYFGGGTPTLFNEEVLSDILICLMKSFDVLADAEITIEANPSTISKKKISVLRKAGVNRISIGLQAWQRNHLKMLGRTHDQSAYLQSILLAKQEGIENINTDIIYALPQQKTEELLETIDLACKLGSTHISLYGLKLEENTPLYLRYLKNEIILPDEDFECEMFSKAKSLLEDNGLLRYEISNFAKPHKESRHNLVYWSNEEYLGLGSAAHSYLDRVRFANISDIGTYIFSINNKGNAQCESEFIGVAIERFETVMLSLRLVKGIDKNKFYERFGSEIRTFYGKTIDSLIDLGLLSENETEIYCTEKGMELNNTVINYFAD